MQDDSALSAAVVIPAPPAAVAARGLHRRIYDRWRRAAHAVGIVQTRVIMLGIYVTVVVPTGVFMRMSRDPLHLRKPDSNWLPVRPHDRSVEAARRQG